MADINERYDIEAERELNLLQLIFIVAKRKTLVIVITLAVAMLSAGYSLALKNIYSATAKILPPQKDTGGLSALLSQAGSFAALAASAGLGGSSDLYVSILKSRSVADDVIKKLDLAVKFKAKNPDAARRKLAAKVKIQAEKNGIISITANDKDPVKAAELANTFVEELEKATVRLSLAKVGSERLFLEKRLEVVKSDLTRSEEELKNFAQKNKVVQVDAQAKVAIEAIAKLKAELASKEVQLSVLRSYQTDESSEVKAVQAAIKRLHLELNRLSGSGTSGGGIPSIGNVPSVGLEYSRRLRDLKIQEAIFDQLTKQYELAKFNEARDSSSFQIIDSAVRPYQKSKPKRAMIVLIFTAAAFFFSIFLTFFLEYLEKMTEDDKVLLASIKGHLFRFRNL